MQIDPLGPAPKLLLLTKLFYSEIPAPKLILSQIILQCNISVTNLIA